MTEPVRASWYDGLTARKREGEAVLSGTQLLLHEDGGDETAITLSELRFHEKKAEGPVYTLDHNTGFRLRFHGDPPADLAERLPKGALYGHWIDRLGLPKAAALFAVVSAAALAAVYTLPAWLGPMIPQSWERKMGDAMLGDMNNVVCHSPAGDKALARLVNEIDPGRPVTRVDVANIDMVNAVALPGGRVLIFDGLIQGAKSADEVAGVLAHEIGHVRERHVMQALLRQFGLSLLLGGANSDIGSTVFGLASTSYTRSAEAEADDYARERLDDANISPEATAGFFRWLSEKGEGPSWVSYISSHPAPSDRQEKFEAAIEEGRDYRPALTPDEFAALETMCEDDPDVEEFGF